MNLVPPSTDPRRPHGFTLVEILVATLAFAALLAAVYVVFANGRRLRDAATARIQDARLRDRAMTVLRRDLRNALVSGGRLGATLLGQWRGPESSFPGYLKFTTTSSRLAEDSPGADLQEVAYYIADQSSATNRNAGMLVRAVERNLLAQVRQVPPLEPLLYEVEALELAFYDGQQWIESWEYTEAGDALPEAVRVRIQPAASSTTSRQPAPLEIVVPWPTQPVTVTTNSASSDTPPEGASQDSQSDSSSGASPAPPTPGPGR